MNGFQRYLYFRVSTTRGSPANLFILRHLEANKDHIDKALFVIQGETSPVIYVYYVDRHAVKILNDSAFVGKQYSYKRKDSP